MKECSKGPLFGALLLCHTYSFCLAVNLLIRLSKYDLYEKVTFGSAARTAAFHGAWAFWCGRLAGDRGQGRLVVVAIVVHKSSVYNRGLLRRAAAKLSTSPLSVSC